MTERDFIPQPYSKSVDSGKVAWESPSNIALVKYWGKRDIQIPENPSISFTLKNCKTITSVSFSQKGNNGDFDFEVYVDEKKKESFKPKIQTFFERVFEYLPFLKDYRFEINTSNTFPHSSGIASSASGMSALAMCLMSIEKQLNPEMSQEFFNRKASFLARLGSGSACRSIEGEIMIWGQTDAIENSSDLYAIKYPYAVHENFEHYQDTILLIDKGEKQVSSTVGHGLMHGHPFAKKRFLQANYNLESLKPVLESGDLDEFNKLMETEALSLHAMMMTSKPYFILMKPNTFKVIRKLWDFRDTTKLPIGFTLDAGANVHILYPKIHTQVIMEFIKDELVAYCENGHYICDEIGLGANQLI